TQGILYLTDTPDEQGATTLVPGFQHRLKRWLETLPPGADPQQQDLHALGSKPIGAGAGDMVIWHQWLPHGSRPNRGTRPRIVQYINYAPLRISHDTDH
ncbi:MAG: phytanoyl-CoA dioxygenase family protein, partial [Gammaproteobacteria bacterium]